MNAAFVRLSVGTIILCLLSSCVTTYQFIQPESLVTGTVAERLFLTSQSYLGVDGSF